MRNQQTFLVIGCILQAVCTVLMFLTSWTEPGIIPAKVNYFQGHSLQEFTNGELIDEKYLDINVRPYSVYISRASTSVFSTQTSTRTRCTGLNGARPA